MRDRLAPVPSVLPGPRLIREARLDYQISFFSKYGAISGDRGFMPHSGHISDRRARLHYITH